MDGVDKDSPREQKLVQSYNGNDPQEARLYKVI